MFKCSSIIPDFKNILCLKNPPQNLFSSCQMLHSNFLKLQRQDFKYLNMILLLHTVYGGKGKYSPDFNSWTIQRFTITVPGAVSQIAATGWMITAELTKTFLSYILDITFIVFQVLWCKLKPLHPINIYKWEVKLQRGIKKGLL